MIIDGRALAQIINNETKREIKKLGITPGLGIIFVGNNTASEHYVSLKKLKAENLGFSVKIKNLKSTVSQTQLHNEIRKLNKDSKIHGIIVQLPLPSKLDSNKAIDIIDHKKDADGIHSINIGNLAKGNSYIIPATPAGIMRIIEYTRTKINGAHAVIVGRSIIVGTPMALLLLQKNATITVCHSKTKNLSEYTKKADILIVATGKHKLIKKSMVQKGACVIDVGSCKIDDKWVGDVDFENVKKVAKHITPVPGGVGPMTVAMLLKNVLKLAK